MAVAVREGPERRCGRAGREATLLLLLGGGVGGVGGSGGGG